ncbi:unnamed protein product [Caenorhabditis bovis]|uniref:VWFA domain-containing protein n=1 Tax=Caenorhabditis bovis TaxID=2654633 RepID=A0A8S1E5A3_9PELO|nr:unnamed protein product [Caenorhabditis bovis]
MLLVILVILLDHVTSCTWPSVDALFILDSTEFVTSFQHQTQVNFFSQVMKDMKLNEAGSKVALAQFTPAAMITMNFANSSSPQSRVNELRYCPCESQNCEKTSVNYIAKSSMTSMNRKSVPDVILVVSNSYQPLNELMPNEPLMSPISPLHVFYVVIGSNMQITRFEPSANTVGLKVADFEHLPQLVSPLCESVNGYVKGSSHTRFGPLCWIIIGGLLLLFLLIACCLGYAIYTYQDENRRLKYRLSESEKNLRKQNEYFTAQLHSQMEKQIQNGEKYAEEMKKQQEIMKAQLDRQLEAAYQHGSKVHILPINAPNTDERRDSGIATSPRENEQKVEVPNDNAEHSDKEREKGDEKEADRHSESSSTDSSTSDNESEDLEELNRRTHLPMDHPARKLPPIDLMFLVDTSSSIGINNFDILKNFICEILKDVDIAPGRSRIAMVQYAQDPSVVFGFDQFYSYESVKRGVMRLNYTGGATMLSKALAFAGGIMYHEQNMKKTVKKHQYMPTPRHDRPQVLCLVSDGYSNDNADTESINLHDRLHVKIFAIVSRIFNKNKLVPITRFEGSVFTIHQRESVAIWLWRQQRIWAEHYSHFVEKEKRREGK